MTLSVGLQITNMKQIFGNSATQLFSLLMKATKQVFVFFSIIILISNSREFIQTSWGGLLSATSKRIKQKKRLHDGSLIAEKRKEKATQNNNKITIDQRV